MKKFLIALNLVVWSFVGYQVKKACVIQKDAKTGKEKEVCKEIKVHKKLDGTKVPEKK